MKAMNYTDALRVAYRHWDTLAATARGEKCRAKRRRFARLVSEHNYQSFAALTKAGNGNKNDETWLSRLMREGELVRDSKGHLRLPHPEGRIDLAFKAVVDALRDFILKTPETDPQFGAPALAARDILSSLEALRQA